MGKLAELWAQWRDLSDGDPRKPEIEKEINKIEQYCIDKGFEGFNSITIFGKSDNKSALYPWHTGAVDYDDIWMVGELNGDGRDLDVDGKVHICDYCKDNQ